MTRLTDADALYMVLVKMKDFGELTAKKAIRVVKNAPTIEAEPVRHGKWMGTVCTACGESTSFYYDCDYCPHCGARIDKEND